MGFEAYVIGSANVTRARHDDEAFAHIQGDCAREHRASRQTRKLLRELLESLDREENA
jgi:hypothetical protein